LQTATFTGSDEKKKFFPNQAGFILKINRRR
jgi:hypothetical protein